MPAKSIDLGGYAYAPKTEIGADWIDGEHTNSSWDLYTKWIIMGNCAQLNYKNEEHNDGAYWNGLRTAQIWARTMKSAGRHVHGFTGYFGKAPGTATHKEDMERFLSDVCGGKSVVYSWRDALTRLPASAATGPVCIICRALTTASG